MIDLMLPGGGPYTLHNLGHRSRVGSVLHRSCTISHDGRLGSAVDDLDHDLSDVCKTFSPLRKSSHCTRIDWQLVPQKMVAAVKGVIYPFGTHARRQQRKTRSAVFHSAVFYSAVFYSAVFYSAVFYSVVFYSAVFYSAVVYSAVFYSAVFYGAVFYNAVFYSAVFCSAFSIVRSSIVWYSVVRFSVVRFITSYHEDESLAELKHQAHNRSSIVRSSILRSSMVRSPMVRSSVVRFAMVRSSIVRSSVVRYSIVWSSIVRSSTVRSRKSVQQYDYHMLYACHTGPYNPLRTHARAACLAWRGR